MNNLKIVTKKEKEKKHDYSNTWINIEYCKRKILGDGFTLKLSDSGSQTFGTVKDSLIYLSWTPPFGTRFSTMSYPISTQKEAKEFQKEFNETYQTFETYAKECYRKLAENPIKWRSAPPKGVGRGVGRFKYEETNVEALNGLG